ncbi:MAG: YciI-like protein [Holophaga sp.]|nr:YciI-like protein [Holophaga sp.]
MHYLLSYVTAPDYLQRRTAFRDVHLGYAWQAVERGELLLGGAVGEPPEGALLLFQGDGPEAAERFAAGDPYVRNGLVLSWSVRPWATVVGPASASPIRPS